MSETAPLVDAYLEKLESDRRAALTELGCPVLERTLDTGRARPEETIQKENRV